MKFKRRMEKAVYFSQINSISFLNILLLFFSFLMLGTGFAIVPGLNVKLPDVVTSKELNKVIVVRISEDNTIYVHGKPALIKDIAIFLNKDKYDTVLVKADKNSNVGILTQVWQACKTAGIGRISFVTNQ